MMKTVVITKPGIALGSILLSALALASPARAEESAKTAPFATVQGWDFTQSEQDAWEWYFPGGTPRKTPAGAFYAIDRDAPGPQLRTLSLSAAEATCAQVEIQAARDTKDGLVPAPIKLMRLYWARERDLPKGGKWPFANERSVEFRALEARRPHVWTADMRQHPLWNGTIKRVFIQLKLPFDALQGSQHFNVFTKRFAFGTIDAQPRTPPSPAGAPGAYGGLKAVESWDFAALEPGQWQWVFLGDAPRKDKKGAAYLTRHGGPGPRLKGWDFRALDASHVRIELDLAILHEQGNTERVEPTKLRLYWARAADAERTSKWPFSNDRSTPFEALEPKRPGIWTADISTHGHWIGTIQELFIEVGVPQDKLEEKDRFRVLVKRIDVLTDYYRASSEQE